MDRAKFYAELRKRGSGVFGSTLSQTQVDMLEMILDEGKARGMDLPQLAYVLATTYHEVGSALQPRAENLNYSARRIRQVWPSRFASVEAAKPYANHPERLANKVYGGRLGNGPEASGDGWRYRGRGFCQITGEASYARLSKLLDIDLVADPDRAMEPRIAAHILFEGMTRGLFTGKKLSDHLGVGKGDFVGARAVVNADVGSNGPKVAAYARAFEGALKAAAYDGQKSPAMSLDNRTVAHASRQVAEKPVEPTSAAPGGSFRFPAETQPLPDEKPGHPSPGTCLAKLVALLTMRKER